MLAPWSLRVTCSLHFAFCFGVRFLTLTHVVEPQRIQLVPAGSSCPQTLLVACLRSRWIPHTEDGAVALPCACSLSIWRPHPVPSGSRSQPWPPLSSYHCIPVQGPHLSPLTSHRARASLCPHLCSLLSKNGSVCKSLLTMLFQNRSDGACGYT